METIEKILKKLFGYSVSINKVNSVLHIDVDTPNKEEFDSYNKDKINYELVNIFYDQGFTLNTELKKHKNISKYFLWGFIEKTNKTKIICYVKEDIIKPNEEYDHEQIIRSVKKLLPRILNSLNIKTFIIQPSKNFPERVDVLIQFKGDNITDIYNVVDRRIRQSIGSLTNDYFLEDMSITNNGVYFALRDKEYAFNEFKYKNKW